MECFSSARRASARRGCGLAWSCGNGSSARRIGQLMPKYQFKPVFPDCYGLYVSVPILIYKKYTQKYVSATKSFGNFRVASNESETRPLSHSFSFFDYEI